MAIDTLTKRRSALTAFQYGNLPSVEPDGTLAADDRLTAWWGYGGNPLGPPPPVGGVVLDRVVLGENAPWPPTVGAPWG